MSFWTLTDDQLLLLDGHADEPMQAVIDGIKLARANGAAIPLVGKVIAEAQQAGWLRIMQANGRFCSLCGKSAGYATYPRNGRRHRKGEPNYDRPLSMAGVCFESSSVFVRGHIDCCNGCDKDKGISAAIVNLIVSQELPVEIRNDTRGRFRKDDQRKCFKCESLIYESEMGRLQTVMGDGYYPGVCPKCGAKSLPFGQSHSGTGKFRMLRKEADQCKTTVSGATA